MPTDTSVVRDVVVVLPGIMGSELYRGNTPVWSLKGGSLVRSIVTLGSAIRGLELPSGIGDHEPDDPADQRVEPRALMPRLHVVPGLWSPIDGYDRLMSFLRGRRLHLVEQDPHDPERIPNLVPFSYDWRLSNRFNARRLRREILPVLERWRSQPGFEDAQLVIIAHSMGGLVARWFLEREGGGEYTRALLTIGTPHRGSVNALTTLVNGIRAGIGPLAIDLGDFARSLPSMYQLLPQYDVLVNSAGGRQSIDASTRGLDGPMVADAIDFHTALASAVAARGAPEYELVKVVGIRQPTASTARFVDDRIRAEEHIDGRQQGGDGTVPRLAAEPVDGRGLAVHPIATRHGSLQVGSATFDLIDELLTREEIIWQGGDEPAETLSVEMEEIWLAEERIHLCVRDMPDLRLRVRVTDESGTPIGAELPIGVDGSVELPTLPAGGYRATVSAPRGGPPPVNIPFLVWDPVAS